VGRVRLSRIVRVFAWTGLTSVGGGRYAYFYESLVARRGWVKREEFVQDLTLCQLLPGPNFSNLAVALGFRLGGPRGAAWGAVALILPGALMLLGLSALYFRGEFSPTMAHGLRGVAAAIVGLVFVTTGRIIPVALRTWRAVVIAAAVFLLVGVLRVNTALTITLVAPVSLWLFRPTPRSS
jgi:chromate transporter